MIEQAGGARVTGKVSDEDVQLGARIRALRLSGRRSLRAVAADAGVTESFLSRVERGIASPSIATLRRIAEALGSTIGGLFEGPASNGRVVRAGERRQLVDTKRKWKEFLLTPRDSKQFQVILSFIEPHTGTGPKPYSHDSDQECVIVLKGRMEFWVADEYYELGEGDSLVFESRLPHRNRNPGPKRAEVLWIISPPSY